MITQNDPALPLELKEGLTENLPYLLSVVFSETYILTNKLQSCHWNYTGPDFYQKHLLFERLYTDLYSTLDRTAENIRSLDVIVPASLDSLLTLSKVKSIRDDALEFINTRLETLLIDINIIRGSIGALSIVATKENKQFILNLCGDLDELLGTFYYLISSHLK